MTEEMLLISEDDLSRAWAKAFLAVIRAPGSELSPLIVRIRGLNDGVPTESLPIREALEESLAAQGKFPCDTTANTLFPRSLWSPARPAEELYQRYKQIFPRIRRVRQNAYGTYFERLIDFANGKKPVNQIKQVIENYRRATARGTRPRRSALQAAIFDPRKDHTFQTRRGFPCLQQLTFFWLPNDGLAISGVYATQDIFTRAYGNYLGLCRLGHFVAHEVGRELIEVQCVSGLAQCDLTKQGAANLIARLEEYLAGGRE